MPKISVLMYVKNGMPYFERAVKSVQSQTLSDIEILIIDGGSSDGTLDLVSACQKEDKRIRLFHCECGSVGAQFNLGVQEAKGEYIGIVESDDYILPMMYETEYRFARENDCDVLRADNYIFFNLDEQEMKIRTRVSQECSLYGRRLQAGTDDEKIHIGGSYWTGLYRRDYLLTNRIRMNESKGAAYQDFGFLFLASAMADSLYILDEAFYCYRKDNPNSSCNRPRNIHAVREEYEFLRRELLDRGLWDRLKNYYYLWKIRNEQWFYHNLNHEDQEQFLPYFYQDLKKDLEVLRSLKGTWNTKEKALIKYAEGPEEYFFKYLKDYIDEWKSACEKLSALGENDTISIFGAGNIGKIMCRYLQRRRVSIASFIDNNPKLWGTEVDGINVRSADCIKQDSVNVFLICSENYAAEIKKDLMERGIEVTRMIMCDDMDACIRFIVQQRITCSSLYTEMEGNTIS